MAKPKWEKLRGKYDPKPLPEEGNFREKVERARKAHENESLESLLALYDTFDQKKDEHEQGIKDMNVELTAVDKLIREKLADQDLRAVVSESGHTFAVDITPYVSIKDKIAFMKFMDAHPELDYLWAIQPKSLQAYVKDLLDSGRDAEVPDSVSVFRDEKIKLKRSKA